ncbi:MAG: secondary thiamine-phosphate synthase enzyme YjbQ [Deltaproteobacteria bacterium]
MIVHHCHVELSTKGFNDCRNITPALEQCLKESEIRNGLLTVMNPGSTGAITTIEYESGAVSDLQKAIERIAPMEIEYAHNLRWGDGNGFSHVRSALMKPSLGIPIIDGKLCLGTWQQAVFLDFDNRPRNRRLVVQIMGT